MNTRALAWPLGVQVFVCRFLPSQLNKPSSILNSVFCNFVYYLTLLSPIIQFQDRQSVRQSAQCSLSSTPSSAMPPSAARSLTDKSSPAVFSSLPASHFLPPTIFCLLSAGTHQLDRLSAQYFQLTASFSRSSIHFLLFVISRYLSAHGFYFTASFSLSSTHCLLFTVCRYSSVRQVFCSKLTFHGWLLAFFYSPSSVYLQVLVCSEF